MLSDQRSRFKKSNENQPTSEIEMKESDGSWQIIETTLSRVDIVK